MESKVSISNALLSSTSQFSFQKEQACSMMLFVEIQSCIPFMPQFVKFSNVVLSFLLKRFVSTLVTPCLLNLKNKTKKRYPSAVSEQLCCFCFLPFPIIAPSCVSVFWHCSGLSVLDSLTLVCRIAQFKVFHC